jgi:hypothetical protein
MTVPQSTGSAADRAGDSPGVQTLARIGYVISGVLHLLLGWLALQLAWSGTSTNADTSGALGTLARNPIGLGLLWAGCIGFAALALLQISEAVAAREGKDKLKAVGKMVVYLALGWSALQFATGAGSDSAEQSQDATASLMSQPAGTVLVVVLGLVVLGVGVYHVVKGAKKKFLEDLEGHPGRFVERAGQLGYVAKGIALAIVGGLFVLAAVQHDPEEASGIDGALRALLELPAGNILLTVIALGLAAYGVYSFGRAKHAKL